MVEQRMNDADGRRNALEVRVLRALEAKPVVSVPAEFAARVVSRVPARRVAVLTPARYGMIAMRVAMAVLVVTLVAVSVRSGHPSPIGLAVQWILCVQLVALALWRSGTWKLGVSEVILRQTPPRRLPDASE
jgi:hypothetical protein